MTALPSVFDIYSPVLSTCRQAHTEVSPILYNNNLFYFDCRTSFSAFFHKIGLRHTCEIRTVAISFWTSAMLVQWDLDSMWKSFRRLAGLQTLEIIGLHL
jgi:hypothetical protein